MMMIARPTYLTNLKKENGEAVKTLLNCSFDKSETSAYCAMEDGMEQQAWSNTCQINQMSTFMQEWLVS